MLRPIPRLRSQHACQTPADSLLRGLVQVLLRESQDAILQAPGVLVRTSPAGKEHPRVHEPRVAPQISLLHVLGPLLVPLRGALVPDGPVRIRGPRHALGAFKHIALADQEAREVEDLVVPVGYGRALVALVPRQQLQTEEGRQGTAALGERAGVDLRGAVVEESDGALLEVEAVALLASA